MAISINDSAQVGSSLALKARAPLDPKTSVQYITDLESLAEYLSPYAMVTVEDGDEAGTIWQYQPDGSFMQLNITAGGAYLDDEVVSDEATFSSSKIDSTYAKIDNVYDKTTSDGKYGTLTQQESNTTQLQLLESKVNSIGTAVQFKGSCSTKGELLLIEDMVAGHMYIVASDESMVDYDPFPSTSYIYDGVDWVFNGVQEITMRDFTLQPINLGSVDENGVRHTEVTGTLSLSNIDFTDFDSEDVSYINGEFTNVKQALDSLLYKDLSITFSTTASTTLERGNVVVDPVFNWRYSKDITQQSMNGTVLENDIRTYTHNGNITSNTTFTLSANDGVKNFTKTVSFAFYDGIYSTSAPITDTFDSEFVTGFKNKKLSNSCKGDYTINCSDGEYIYFAIPSSIANNLVFYCGGFEGGFELVADNTSIENIYNSTCDYDIFRSSNHSLGQTTITIK